MGRARAGPGETEEKDGFTGQAPVKQKQRRVSQGRLVNPV